MLQPQGFGGLHRPWNGRPRLRTPLAHGDEGKKNPYDNSVLKISPPPCRICLTGIRVYRVRGSVQLERSASSATGAIGTAHDIAKLSSPTVNQANCRIRYSYTSLASTNIFIRIPYTPSSTRHLSSRPLQTLRPSCPRPLKHANSRLQSSPSATTSSPPLFRPR